jgi:opacity protein-like surface antigen
MTLKHALLAAVAVVATASVTASPALAQQVWRIASNDNLTVDERAALVDSWRSQWQFRTSLMVGLETFRRGELIGRDVFDRDGRSLGRVVTEARYVGGGLAGVEVALGDERAVWIKTPFLRYNSRDALLFTRLSPGQTTERARLASNNPFPAG